MMMPVFPGAPWLPKFSGTDETRYADWKEQIKGLLATQELDDDINVSIIIGALVGEPKRQIRVLAETERNTTRKVFAVLDSLYGDRTPHAVLRSQFFGCLQRPGESIPSFLLRLRELDSRLQQHDPDGPPSAAALRDQLLIGLRESPMAQALKVYARRHPTDDFAALRQEALFLEEEYGRPQPEVTCAAVNPSYNHHNSRAPTSQETDWKEAMKREIMESVKSQMEVLTRELMNKITPLLQTPQPQVPQLYTQNRRESPRQSYTNDRDEQGKPICFNCRKSGHLARHCRSGAASAQSPLN